jgi:hypothetical protein
MRREQGPIVFVSGVVAQYYLCIPVSARMSGFSKRSFKRYGFIPHSYFEVRSTNSVKLHT